MQVLLTANLKNVIISHVNSQTKDERKQRMFVLEEYLADLEELVNTDSNSHDPEGLSKVTDVAEKIAHRFGFFVKRHKTSPESGDVLEISNVEDSDFYDLMIMGHLDTVLPPGFSKERPFACDGEYIYGPGTFDMKAGCLCGLYAAKEICDELKDKLSFVIVFNCDEEITSIYSKNITYAIAKKSSAALVLESTGNRGVYTNRRKGQANYKIKFHGVPGHAGYIFNDRVANAVVEMGRWATELHKLNDPVSLLSVNVAIANGGSVINVVPDYAELSVNIRMVNQEQFDFFESAMQKLAETPMIKKVTVEIETLSKTPPMNPAKGMDEYLERVRKAFASIGQPFDLYPLRGGCSDGNLIADAGTVCIDSLGPLGADDHTPHEKVWLDDVLPCIMRIKALLEDAALHKSI